MYTTLCKLSVSYLLIIILFANRYPLNPGCTALVRGIRFQFFPAGFFWFFVSGGVTSLSCRLFVDVVVLNVSRYARYWCEAKGNQNKPNGLYLSDV